MIIKMLFNKWMVRIMGGGGYLILSLDFSKYDVVNYGDHEQTIT